MSRCAKTAECRVTNHPSICLCPQGLQGNPKVECKRIECRSNSECEQTKSCIEGSCVNLCLLPNACGISAQCKSIRHKKKCSCPQKYVGNPNIECIPDKNECLSSPCGSNAICTERNRAGSCRRIPEYFGDPYVACRPECTINPECPSNKACRNLKCVDPCPGLCGINAECRVINHLGTCTCFPGYCGDLFTLCLKPPPTIELIVADDPCDPNPCGDNSLPPRQVGDRCQYSCMPEMIGSPPNCRSECSQL